MNIENELLEKFQVEELEKRYEMSWVGSSKDEEPPATDEPLYPDYIHFVEG
jgi:hypothetical protein